MTSDTQTKKEDKQVEKCKDPDDNYSKQISKLIKHTIREGNKVWLTTDWHLWIRKEKGKTECVKRYNFDKVIDNYKKNVNKDDLVIHLGDLVDGEFQDKESLKNIIMGLTGNKILVRGNNDLFDYNFYKSIGFMYVTRSFVYNNILFSHFPLENDNDLNIHGHIHGYKTYWIPYTNQIDVFETDRHPVLLQDVIISQPKYAKTIKIIPSKFEQESSLFDEVMNGMFVNDPYSN